MKNGQFYVHSAVEKCSIVGIFSRLGLFLQFVWAGQAVAHMQFLGQLIFLLCDLDQHGGVLRRKKNDQL